MTFEDRELVWREAPARWALTSGVPRRHELEDAWRSVLRSELNPVLGHWQEALRLELRNLGDETWSAFWHRLRGIDAAQPSQLAEAVLSTTSEIYGHGLGIYLNQLELPIDDAWPSDLAWAFRASRFDSVFGERGRVPLLIRALRDLSIELTDLTNLRHEYGQLPGVRCLAVEVPADVRILQCLTGGWQDYAASLRGLGMALHPLHTDPTLRVWERVLGDDSPTIGYGLLFEGLLRDKTWLASRLDYVGSDDFRTINHLAGLYRVRSMAALIQVQQELWQNEPGSSVASAFEETMSAATRTRHFPEAYLLMVLGAPWTTLGAALQLRAEVFAAQLRSFLQREFDEEWWRSNRAARFIKDELWRPGRRHSAEELLGFMGFEGFDPAILVGEVEEVLRPL
jgi:hypothetical protein